MKVIAKLFLRTFLFLGIPYVLFTLGFALVEGDEFQFWRIFFLTFFFGFTMSLFMVAFHVYVLEKSGIQEFSDETLDVNQSKNIISDLNKSELIKRLRSDPIIGKMKIEETENGVIIKTGMSWKSWGEEIKIVPEYHSGVDCEYHISSSPRWKLTLVDFGKNYENITRIEQLLNSIA